MYKIFYWENFYTKLKITKNNEIHIFTYKKNDIKNIEKIIENHFKKTIEKFERQKQKHLINFENNFIHIFNEKYLIKYTNKIINKKYEILNSIIYINKKNELDKIKILKLIYHDRVTEYMKNSLEKWAKIINVKYSKINFKWFTAKWGSCDYLKGEINLAYQLGAHSKHVIDYVIIHELCHLIVPNHSSNFYQEVIKYCPNYKKISKILNFID